MDVFNLELVSDPRVSPDGRSVVYVRQFSDVMTDRFYSNLWIVGTDGSGNRPLTTGNVHDNTPRWSPDGTRLAWISDREGSLQVTLRWMDSGQTATLTSLTEPPSGLEWSPDGTRLAFAKRVPEPALVVGQMPSAPPGAEWAPPAKYTDDLVFRFNGVGEIPPGATHLFVIPAEGGTARQVTHGDKSFATGFWGPGAFTWDADGKSLLVSANLRDDRDMEMMDTEIYRVAVADGAATALTHRKGPDDVPAVSPDGRWIAYLGFDDRYQGYQNTLLWVMRPDGAEAHSISDALDRDVDGIRWAPDSRGVYGTFVDEGDPKLALFTLDGRHEVVAEGLGSGRSSYAGAGSFSVASDGTLAFTVTDPHRPGDVAIARRGGQTRVLTQVNEDLLGSKRLGSVEELWWESSKDGRRIQGWIVKPPDFDPSKKYPLVLEIHGGPFAAYGDGFDVEKQMMAAEGFVILYANPRGSTSYGEEFGNLIHHAYPGDDFYDLDSGVDAVGGRRSVPISVPIPCRRPTFRGCVPLPAPSSSPWSSRARRAARTGPPPPPARRRRPRWSRTSAWPVRPSPGSAPGMSWRSWTRGSVSRGTTASTPPSIVSSRPSARPATWRRAVPTRAPSRTGWSTGRWRTPPGNPSRPRSRWRAPPRPSWTSAATGT